MKIQNNLIARLLFTAITAMFFAGSAANETFAKADKNVICPFPSGYSGGTPLEQKAKAMLPDMSDLNPNKVPCQKALEAMLSAQMLIIGTDAPAPYTYDWINSLANDQSAEYKGKFQEGLKLAEALKWLKNEIAADKNSPIRKAAISRAMKDVYGRDALGLEILFYEAAFKTKEATYTSIVAEEKKKLNQNAAERKQMIVRVYQTTMGRDANAGEINYWQPRPEHFVQIVEANRAYLYTSGGEKDLKETIFRVFALKKKPQPDDALMDRAIKTFTLSKKIYAEMLENSLNFPTLPI